jgi:virginiamycin B lyase
MNYMSKRAAILVFPSVIAVTAALIGPAQAAVGDAQALALTTANSAPFGILSGPGNDLWVTQRSSGRIARINTSSAINEIPLPGAPDGQPEDLAVGDDSRVWVTERQANRISAITPSNNAVQTFPLPTAQAQPTGITAGPDKALWFTERAGNRIGRITTAGAFSFTPLEASEALPTDITAGPDGALWFTMAGANSIGRITTGGVVSVFPIPRAASEPTGIVLGPDNNLWFTMAAASAVGRLTSSGVFAEFALPTADSRPLGITVGVDSNLWVAQSNARRIARITPAGGITEFALPDANANPTGVASSVDGNIWTTSPATNRVYRILTGQVPVRTQAPAITGPSTAVGQQLTVSQGAWRFVPTQFTYEWQRCSSADAATCVSIPDARSATYTIVGADAGAFLRALVTAVNANGPSIAAASNILQIDGLTPPPPPPVPAPVVGGQVVQLGNGVTATLRGPNKVRRGVKRSYAVVMNNPGVKGKVRIVLTNARGNEIRVIAKGRSIRPDGRAVRTWIMPRNIKVRTVTLRATFTPASDQRTTYPQATMSKPLRILR